MDFTASVYSVHIYRTFKVVMCINSHQIHATCSSVTAEHHRSFVSHFKPIVTPIIWLSSPYLPASKLSYLGVSGSVLWDFQAIIGCLEGLVDLVIGSAPTLFRPINGGLAF